MSQAGYGKFVVAGVFNTLAPSPVSGQEVPLQVDSSGNILVNIAAGSASGTQYADGTTQATPTGTVALGKNPSNVLHALALDASGNLNVNLAAGTISGGNAAASATGAAVPASADYIGVNIGGNLVGVTGFSLTGSKAAAVAIVDGSGNQITSFGGGTQFADNAASGATPTGTLSMGWDSVNSKIRALKVDASQNLDVNVQAIGTVTVTGTITVGNASLAVTQSTSPWVVAGGNAAGSTSIANPVIGGGSDYGGTPKTQTLKVDSSGQIYIGNASIAVTGTFFQATQPVSIAATVAENLTQVAGTNLGATAVVNFGTAPAAAAVEGVNASLFSGTTGLTNTSGALDVNLKTSAATVTVSGTVTSNQGGAPWTVKPDGTVWALTGTSANVNVTNTVTVSGTVTANQGTANATPWNENVAQFGGNPVVTGTGIGGAGIPRVTVSSDSFPATQPISAASLPLPANAAQETGGNLATIATQTRNDAQIVDLLSQILAQSKYNNMLLASSSTADIDDADTIATTLMQ